MPMFVGIDGEGITVDGKHRYIAMCADGGIHKSHIVNMCGITRIEAEDFILSIPKKYTVVGYFLNYDISMILKDVHKDPLSRIAEGETVNLSGTEWTWLRGKFVKLKRGKTSRRVWDVAGFFGTSFIKALDSWNIGTKAELRVIREMKEQRGNFADIDIEQILYYCHKECYLLARLITQLQKSTEDAGFSLRSYHGAGAMATTFLRKWKVKNYMPIQSEPFEELDIALPRAYFGGRFECSHTGWYPDTVYQYDIRSAYPNAMKELPCLACGFWTKDPRSKYTSIWSIWHVKWNIPRASWGPFPWRSHTGEISFPLHGAGWYWEPEVAAALKVFGDRITVTHGYQYITQCEHKPFTNISLLYKERQRLKEIGDKREYVLKLGLNSLYGKTAQTVGRREFSSTIWAGLTTSITRARLLYALSTKPHKVFMLATDGLFSTEKLLLPEGSDLGRWELQTHDNILVVQPGVYAVNVSGPNEHIRSRGVRRTDFIPSTAVSKLMEFGPMKTGLEIPFTTFIGVKRGLISREHNIGDWIQETRTLSFIPKTKRIPIPKITETSIHKNPFWYRWDPVTTGIGDLESQPYTAMILDPNTLIDGFTRNEQPDPTLWNPGGGWNEWKL